MTSRPPRRGVRAHALRTIASIFVACCVLATASTRAGAMSYADSLAATARTIDHAANTGRAVPALHVPPAPLGGPPRYSPSVDDWLQSVLADARRLHAVKARALKLRAIAATLQYLSRAVPQPAAVPHEDVGAAAARILAEPAFNAVRTKPAPPPQETLWERFLAWLQSLLATLFGGVVKVAQGAPYLGSVFAIALLVLAAAGLAYVAFRLAQGRAVRRPAAAEAGALIATSAGVDELARRADVAARDGRFADAVAWLFQASLVLLDRRGRVRYDATRTAGEYRRLVRRGAPKIADDFDGLARIFVIATFADAAATERDFEAAQARFGAIVPALHAA